MCQVLFRIPIPWFGGEISIFGFGMMLFIAFLSATWMATWLCRREGLNADRVMDLGLWMFLGGIVGARLFFMVQYRDQFGSVWEFFKIWQGGIVFYGGVIAAILVFLYYTRRHRMPVWKVLDVAAPAVALGMGVGRFGCLLNGCCWGRLSQLPWAITFPAQSFPWLKHLDRQLIESTASASLPVHPTQIYLALDGFGLAALTLLFYRFRRRDGEVMSVLMVSYAISRFFLEYLRDDVPPMADGLTISQNLSIVLLAGGIFMWCYLPRQPAGSRTVAARV